MRLLLYYEPDPSPLPQYKQKGRKKPEFILRKIVNYTGPKGRQYVTFDVMRVIEDGEEFICEFQEIFEDLARKTVKALNKP